MLATEMYKVKNGLFHEIMNEIFQLKVDNYYNIRQVSQFIFLHANSFFNKSESVSHRRPSIWGLILSEIKYPLFHCLEIEIKPKDGT